MSNEVLNPYQQFQDDGGTLLDRGAIEFFENGQEVTQLSIFSDSDLTVAQSNPYTLDDFGQVRGDVHYQGLATLVITNAAGLRIRRLDNVVASSDGNTGNITVYEQTVAAMVTDESLIVGDIVRTQAYFAQTNLGGARYVIVAGGTGTPDNYLFHNLANGLQAKLLEREKRRNYLYAGARGDGSDDTVPMQSVINAFSDIQVPDGFTFSASNLTIASSVRFVGGGRMQQIPGSSGDLLQITTRVASIKFKGVKLDGNQNNGNATNHTVGWVLTA